MPGPGTGSRPGGWDTLGYTSVCDKIQNCPFSISCIRVGVNSRAPPVPKCTTRCERPVLCLSRIASWGQNTHYPWLRGWVGPKILPGISVGITKKYIHCPCRDSNPNSQFRRLVTLPRYFGYYDASYGENDTDNGGIKYSDGNLSH